MSQQPTATKEEARKAIRELVKDMIQVQTERCTVDSVDKNTLTMECTSIRTGLKFYDVYITLEEENESVVVFPEQGSKVIIGLIENMKGVGFLMHWSKVSEVYLRGDQYGSLIKIEDLVDKINRLEQKHNDLVSSFNTHTHPFTNADGTPSTTSSTSSQSSAQVQPQTNVSDLENDKVKHG